MGVSEGRKGGTIPMSTATIRSEEILTDKQFDSIIEMVIQILSRSKDLDDAREALLAIKRGGTEDKDERPKL
jgi:hypothetical protein